MGLLDILQKKIDTGFVLEISPLDLEEVKRYSETSLFNCDWCPGPTSAIEAAYFSNQFHGDYSLYYGKKDQGFKPILVPAIPGKSRKIISAKIVLPNYQESYKFNYPTRSTGQDWFNMFFTEFNLNEKNYRCRVYCSTKKRQTIFQAMQETKSKPFTRLTDKYDLRLYDISLKMGQDKKSFLLTNIGWPDLEGKIIEE